MDLLICDVNTHISNHRVEFLPSTQDKQGESLLDTLQPQRKKQKFEFCGVSHGGLKTTKFLFGCVLSLKFSRSTSTGPALICIASALTGWPSFFIPKG